jgi:hypothetical protein
MIIFLSLIVENTQVGFDDRPVLIQIVVGLLIKARCQIVAEKEADSQKKQRKYECINGR